LLYYVGCLSLSFWLGFTARPPDLLAEECATSAGQTIAVPLRHLALSAASGSGYDIIIFRLIIYQQHPVRTFMLNYQLHQCGLSSDFICFQLVTSYVL